MFNYLCLYQYLSVKLRSKPCQGKLLISIVNVEYLCYQLYNSIVPVSINSNMYHVLCSRNYGNTVQHFISTCFYLCHHSTIFNFHFIALIYEVDLLFLFWYQVWKLWWSSSMYMHQMLEYFHLKQLMHGVGWVCVVDL